MTSFCSIESELNDIRRRKAFRTAPKNRKLRWTASSLPHQRNSSRAPSLGNADLLLLRLAGARRPARRPFARCERGRGAALSTRLGGILTGAALAVGAAVLSAGV